MDSSLVPSLTVFCLKFKKRFRKVSENGPRMLPKSSQCNPKMKPEGSTQRGQDPETELGPNWGVSWEVLGGILGPSWDVLGRLGPSWGHLGSSWRRLGPIRIHLGSSWSRPGPSWGHRLTSWGQLGGIMGQLWNNPKKKTLEKQPKLV